MRDERGRSVQENVASMEMESVRLLSQRAQEALTKAHGLIRSSVQPIDSFAQGAKKWYLFLDQRQEHVETCGMAAALIILVTCGEPIDSSLVEGAKITLKGLHLKGSGWTSWVSCLEDLESGRVDEALTLDTFYATRALLMADESSSSDPVAAGLRWLEQSFNHVEGGWGFFSDDKAYTLPTSYAVRILVAGYGLHETPRVRDMIKRATEWLLICQQENEDGGWGRCRGQPSSAVHTAAVLMSLMDAGWNRFSTPVIQGRNWLLSHTEDRLHIRDVCYVPERDGERRIIGRQRLIDHINFPEGLIAQGLLWAETNLLDPRLLSLISRLLDLQEGGAWQLPEAPASQPIYAIMDACLALDRFVTEIKEAESVLEVAETVQIVQAGLSRQVEVQGAIEERQQTLEATVDELRNTLGQLQDELQNIAPGLRSLRSDIQSFEKRIRWFEEGLTLLRPMMWISRMYRKYTLFSVLMTLLLLSVIVTLGVTLTVGQESPLYSVASLVVNGILTLFNLVAFFWQVYPQRRQIPTDSAQEESQ